jgi:hypothetical protein
MAQTSPSSRTFQNMRDRSALLFAPTRSVNESSPVGQSLREAVVTMLAMLATLACAKAIDPEPGPAVLAVVLCLSFSRSHLDRDLRGRLEAAIALPLVGLLATGRQHANGHPDGGVAGCVLPYLLPLLRRTLGMDRAHRVHRQQRQSWTARCGVQERVRVLGAAAGTALALTLSVQVGSHDTNRCTDSGRGFFRDLAAPTWLCVVGALRHAGAGPAAGF